MLIVSGRLRVHTTGQPDLRGCAESRQFDRRRIRFGCVRFRHGGHLYDTTYVPAAWRPHCT